MTDEAAPPFDASDPKAVTERNRKVRRDKNQQADDLAVVLATIEGRRCIWGLLNRCHLFELSHVQGDALQTAFREGERNAGQKLFADLMNHHPETYAQMAREAQEPTNG